MICIEAHRRLETTNAERVRRRKSPGVVYFGQQPKYI
jgi:hypothetical protein